MPEPFRQVSGLCFERQGQIPLPKDAAAPYSFGFPISVLYALGAKCDAMPKQKTHKGTKKRFRLSATGKVKHRQAGTSHLAFRMTPKRRRNLRGTTTLSKTVVKSIHRALNGYSS